MSIDKSVLYVRAAEAGVDRHIIDQITEGEGLRLVSYRCPTGHITIGWGHNLEAKPVPGLATLEGVKITRELADRLLIRDIEDARRDMEVHFPWANGLSEPRQAVLLDMVFNMGPGKVEGFRQALAAMRRGDFEAASAEMLDSTWARQVGGRAERLARQMASGEWQA